MKFLNKQRLLPVSFPIQGKEKQKTHFNNANIVQEPEGHMRTPQDPPTLGFFEK